jgi:tetratricopeptide (TPR) repeat protein/predicted Ser/Thr protein kinase
MHHAFMAVLGQSGFPFRLAHYEITGELGQGGMGAVYKAIDTKLGRPVALKVISRHSITEDDRRRFAREATAASALNHPNIVTIHAYDTVDGVDFIAMELIEGETLDHYLTFRSTPAPLEILRQVAAALAVAHAAGITHRDLKPANIMITPSGLVKVLDFGLSKRDVPAGENTQSALTQAGAVIGTPAYMSPEQALGEHTDWRTDIFSFGVILYEVACGKRPFHGRNVMAILHAVVNAPHSPPANISPALATLIESCLVKDRARRLQSIAEAVTVLSPASSVNSAIHPAQRRPRSRLPLTAAVTVTLILAAAWTGRHAIRSWLTVNAPSVVSPTAHGHYQAGTALLFRRDVKGNIDSALAQFQQAIALDPSFAPAYAGLSAVYLDRNGANPDPQWIRLARDAAERSRQLTPELAIAHLAVAQAAMLSKKEALAQKELDEALRLDPRNADVHRAIGTSHLHRGDAAGALQSYNKALALAPRDWRILHDLGVLHYREARYSDAVAAWRSAAIGLTPESELLHRQTGAALHMLGQHDLAAEEFQKALAITPTGPIYNNLGTIRFFQGRYNEAVEALEKAVQLRANAYQYWGNLADAYRWSTHMRDKAPMAYSHAIELARAEAKARPSDWELRSRIALYLAKLGDPPAARAELLALPAANRSASVSFRAAVTWELLRDRTQALLALQAAANAGYSRIEIENEPELAPLRQDIRYHLQAAQGSPSAKGGSKPSPPR